MCALYYRLPNMRDNMQVVFSFCVLVSLLNLIFAKYIQLPANVPFIGYRFIKFHRAKKTREKFIGMDQAPS